jgi:hypothetical protein
MAPSWAAVGADTPPETAWYQLSADDCATRLGVDPAVGLTAAQVAQAAARDGPNALPAENSGRSQG